MTDPKVKNNLIERPPIVAIMGHIDHGKSTLLDYIRKSNVVAGEAGGITQHISAYEVNHKLADGREKRITFLDTPGHEAFTAMRARGASIADVAVLIVSAEDGPKTQTIEAYKSIKEASIPFVVAINKIDRPGANVEKTKTGLMEKEIYLEGFGGDIPFALISAKTGQGVSELLDTVLLVAEMENLKANQNRLADGFVLEANLDSKRGVCSTLIVTSGTLKVGDFVVSENKFASIRTMENFLGENIKEATFSSPVRITGFKEIPSVGSIFTTYEIKKEAEKVAQEFRFKKAVNKTSEFKKEGKLNIPLIIKADVLGTIEAILHEIEKIKSDRVALKIIYTGAGNISENDVKLTGNDSNSLVIGFNVKVDRSAKDLMEKMGIDFEVSDIIYKLTEWIEEKVKERTPKVRTEKTIGRAKILRTFSQNKNNQVVGGQVLEGFIKTGANVKIIRRDFELERGHISGLQSQKIEIKEVKEGEQFGVLIEAKKEIAAGDYIEAFEMVEE